MEHGDWRARDRAVAEAAALAKDGNADVLAFLRAYFTGELHLYLRPLAENTQLAEAVIDRIFSPELIRRYRPELESFRVWLRRSAREVSTEMGDGTAGRRTGRGDRPS
jgi:hypothetical protein